MTYLSDKAVQEFKEIWELEYKEKLTDEEGRIKAENLLSVFELVLKPKPKKELLVK